MEVGIYNVSHKLLSRCAEDDFIETMLQSIEWTVLGPLLSLQAASVQAFAKRVFLRVFTTKRLPKRLQIIDDLLRHD